MPDREAIELGSGAGRDRADDGDDGLAAGGQAASPTRSSPTLRAGSTPSGAWLRHSAAAGTSAGGPVGYASDRSRGLSATPATSPIGVAGVADRRRLGSAA